MSQQWCVRYSPLDLLERRNLKCFASRWPFLKGCSPVLLAVDGKPILPDVSVHLNSNHWISISANLSPDHRESLKTTRPSRIGYRPQKFPASQEPTNVKNRSSPITTSVSPCLDEKTETALKTISAAIKSKKVCMCILAIEDARLRIWLMGIICSAIGGGGCGSYS